jgi:hypothetical protein
LHSSPSPYNPAYLDCIEGERQRLLVQLKGYTATIFQYVRPREMNNALNQRFRIQHEAWLNQNTGMTLSKLRKLKLLLAQTAQHLDLEMSTAALAYVGVERLMLRNLIHKVGALCPGPSNEAACSLFFSFVLLSLQSNRKLVAATCLLLAFKFNEPVFVLRGRSGAYKRLFATAEEVFQVKRRDIIRSEFGVWAALHFDLSFEPEAVLPHMMQMLDLVGFKMISYAAGTHWQARQPSN